MTGLPTVRARTGLSPEWDNGFDEAFTDLVCSDDDLVRAEFDALIRASWRPPVPPVPPAPHAGPAESDPPDPGDAERRFSEPYDADSENAQPP